MTKKRDLPRYCYARNNQIWVRYKDVRGKWVNKRTKYTIDQVEQARRYVLALVKGVQRKVETGNENLNTVRDYAEKWCTDRENRGIASAKDERRHLEKYALQFVGELGLEEITPMHVRDMVRGLLRLKDENGEKLLAPRTIHHIYSTLHNMFESTIIEGLVLGNNPVKVAAGELPKKQDADAEWRSQATFTVREVERLVSEPIIPVERRVQYALKAIAGLRHGEVAALCWRHIDADAEPLHRINVVQAWCSRNNIVKSTKTGETRAVPMHPTLAKILVVWRHEHWQRIYGRPPGDDDYVVPTRTLRCVAASDANEAFKRDLAALGLRIEAGKKRDRGGHDLRSWYETRCIEDGADYTLLRRTTHAPPKTVSGGYERFSWAVLCREVAKLRIEVLDGEVLKLVTGSLQVELKAGNRWRNSVTPKGLEPLFSDGSRSRVHAQNEQFSSRNSAVAITGGRSGVTTRDMAVTPLVTVAGMLERAIAAGDAPRALEIVRHLREMGDDPDVREHMRRLREVHA